MELGGGHYNLACFFAIKGNEKEAIHYLELSLSKSAIDVNFVESDEDWKDFLNKKEFIDLMKKHRLKYTKA